MGAGFRGSREWSRALGTVPNGLYGEESLRSDLCDHPGEQGLPREGKGTLSFNIHSLGGGSMDIRIYLRLETAPTTPRSPHFLYSLTTVSLSICNLETGVPISCLSPPLDHTLCLISGLSGPGAEWACSKGQPLCGQPFMPGTEPHRSVPCAVVIASDPWDSRARTQVSVAQQDCHSPWEV